MGLGGTHRVVLVVQHLQHVGDVAVLVGRAQLVLAARLPGPGVVRVGRGGRGWSNIAGLALLAAAPDWRRSVALALALVVVGVGPPHVELSEQVLPVAVRQPLLEVLLGEVDQGLAVHVPQVEVQQGHRGVELLGSEQQPRAEVLAGPVSRIWW